MGPASTSGRRGIDDAEAAHARAVDDEQERRIQVFLDKRAAEREAAAVVDGEVVEVPIPVEWTIRPLSLDEACVLVGVKRRTLYTWIRAGKLDYVRTAGGAVRIWANSLFRPAIKKAKT